MLWARLSSGSSARLDIPREANSIGIETKGNLPSGRTGAALASVCGRPRHPHGAVLFSASWEPARGSSDVSLPVPGAKGKSRGGSGCV